MRRVYVFAVVWATGLCLGLFGGRMLGAQDPLAMGKELHRTELTAAKGMEGILVLRELPAGAESGKHTQSGNEIVYILEGSAILEVQGKGSCDA